MSTEERYNGWANRETWAVALHINNDQGWRESVLDALREADPREGRNDVRLSAVVKAGEIVKDNVETLLSPGSYEFEFGQAQPPELVFALYDIGSLWRVDWTEIGAAFLEDLAEQDGER